MTCSRCGETHQPYRQIIASVSDAVYNDRIARECETNIIKRMKERPA